MKFLDALRGRSPAAPANLEALFALPSAAIKLETEADLAPTGEAGVCFRPSTGASFESIRKEMDELLAATAAKSEMRLRQSDDSFGYHWVTISASGMEDLVNDVHLVNSELEQGGFGDHLLCSVFGFGAKDGSGTPRYLVYIYKRGSFYPFVPLGDQRRDNEAELRLKALLAGELKVEPDLSRWFPIWDCPVT